MNEDLAFAFELADEADAITLSRFRATDLRVETKPDMTPVSEADRAVEEALRARIASDRPGEAVVGEELGADGAESAPVRWILDPIDATKNYVRGIPLFATLIALESDGRLEVGVVSAPALGRRWWAVREDGAFADGRPIRVSQVARIEDAVVAYTSAPSFFSRGRGEAFVALTGRAWAARGYGDFWQYMLVAEGAVEVGIDCDVSLWDVAAVKVVVEEAGGRLTDLSGADRADGGSALATNGLLHDEALRALS